MNKTQNLLEDIELAPALTDYSIMVGLIVLLGLLIAIAIIWFFYQYQQPVNKAIKQLKALADSPIKPTLINAYLQQALQTKQLAGTSLPKAFIQRLDQACFSPTPCSLETYLALKQEALSFLQQVKKGES